MKILISFLKRIRDSVIYRFQDKGSKRLPGFFDPSKYINDQVKVLIEFQVYFISSACIQEIKIDANGLPINLQQKEQNFRVVFKKDISKKLFDDLLHKKFGSQWILGYIAEILPYVNHEILRQRYVYAYFLLKTFTTLDIAEIRLINRETNRGLKIKGPINIDKIPLDNEIARLHDNHLYFRDLVDAVNA